MDISAWIDEQIGWIVLNRPQVKNAISREMWEAIPRALRSLQEAGARVVIFRGEGESFAAGADLAELSKIDSKETARDHWLAIRDSLNAVASFELPTIAMIVGPCMGGGCLLAAACDMRFCEPNARFSVPVAQLGIALDHDNIARLISIMGKGIAEEMLFTGNIMSASRAQAVGLVNGMVPVAGLDRAVMSVAEEIKRSSPTSIKQIKTAIADVCQRGRVEQDQEPLVASYLSDDFRTRVAKALAKRS
jgi:enoyl-CoA hydratase